MAIIGTLDFTTDKQWTAQNLGDFVGRLDNAYAVFLGLSILRRADSGPFNVRELETQLTLDYAEKTRGQEWQHELLGDGQQLKKYFHRAIRSDKSIQTYLLEIHRVSIASPGLISFKGLGEPLRELREFIKDLCYRNNQERRRGELDLAKGRLELAKQVSEYMASRSEVRNPQALDGTVLILVETVREVRRLEHDQKLTAIGKVEDSQ